MSRFIIERDRSFDNEDEVLSYAERRILKKQLKSLRVVWSKLSYR